MRTYKRAFGALHTSVGIPHRHTSGYAAVLVGCCSHRHDSCRVQTRHRNFITAAPDTGCMYIFNKHTQLVGCKLLFPHRNDFGGRKPARHRCIVNLLQCRHSHIHSLKITRHNVTAFMPICGLYLLFESGHTRFGRK